MYFAPLEMASDIDRIFSSLYFERLRIPSAVGTPEEIVGKLRTELNATNAALDQVKKEIADYWAKEKNLCLQVHARYKQLATLFGVRQYAGPVQRQVYLGRLDPLPGRRKSSRPRWTPSTPSSIPLSRRRGTPTTRPLSPCATPGLSGPSNTSWTCTACPGITSSDPTAFVAITFTLLFGIMSAI